MTEPSDSPNKSLMDTSNKDKVALKLIRVSGQTHTFYFPPATSATEISKHVFDNWPEAWTEGSGNSASVLRLLYQGRFLHGNTSLAGLKLPVGKTTVMHLVSRETVTEPQSAEERSGEKNRSSRLCCSCCTIL